MSAPGPAPDRGQGVHRKILALDALRARLARHRDRGEIVVQCHGCFDIVHPGHIRYLEFAKGLGDVLVVSVSADAVVAKGHDRPYIHEGLRLENLAALEFVDYVCLDEHDWAGPVLDALRPDVYVKGREYATGQDPRFARERELVEGYGGRVVFSSGDVVYSSTAIIDRFRARLPLEGERLRAYCERHGVSRPALEGLIRRFAGKRILVVGDPVLDHYVHCEALGVAAESPVLSVAPVNEDWFVGAAGLIALQLAELGAEATLLTSLDRSPEADRFSAGLEAGGVELAEIDDEERPLFVKTRYLVDDQKVFKVDQGHLAPLSSRGSQALAAHLEALVADYDAVVASDFGYGLFDETVIAALVASVERAGRPYYVDVSQSRQPHLLRFERPRLATPTERELRFAFADNESGISNLASRYYQRTGAEQLVLTLGKRGLVVFKRSEHPGGRLPADYLPAFSPAAVDAVGAGDVTLSALVLADLAGAPLELGAYLGSCLAALHVSRLGNHPVAITDLEDLIARRMEAGR